MPLNFPTGFFWGASTSAHQVEGNLCNNWTEWERSAKRKQFLHDQGHIDKHGYENFLSDVACDHYTRYKEDFALAKELGHMAHRFSIEWSRIEPEEGVFNEFELEHYKDVIKTLRQHGMEPFVTLYHWPIPLWLDKQGGWKHKKSVGYFNRYVEKVVSYLKDDVTFWITLNEPTIISALSHQQGIWPPEEKNILSYLRVKRRLIVAHKVAYQTIKTINHKSQVGIAHNMQFIEPANHKPLNLILSKLANWWSNTFFLNQIKPHQDFIGVNHYFHHRINGSLFTPDNENKKTSDLGWELYPEAMYHVLMIAKRYNKPIYITENGLADRTDEKRPWFLVESLKQVHRAIQDGADVRGYLHWSFMDNFEWAEGFWPRFGLVEIDYETLERKPRPSAYLYREIIRKNGIDTSSPRPFS